MQMWMSGLHSIPLQPFVEMVAAEMKAGYGWIFVELRGGSTTLKKDDNEGVEHQVNSESKEAREGGLTNM